MTDHIDHERPVLFAFDGSEQATAAIAEAARQLGAGRRAIVLTVWTPLSALPFARSGVAFPDVEQSLEEEASGVADEGARLATSAGFAATALARPGGPVWEAIVAAADEHDASIVVMGSHGRTGLGLVLMGSVAAAVARHTDRPVMIVHAAPQAGEGRRAA
jgi:nucleotide-binding universal stress UspA family protein